MTDPSSEPSQGFDVAQEQDVIASRKVSAVFCATLLLTVMSVATSGWILMALRPPSRKHRAPQPAPRQIAGIHQTPIARDRHGWEQRDQQRATLQTYRWIDRAAGTAQIPIERAMQLILERAARARADKPGDSP